MKDVKTMILGLAANMVKSGAKNEFDRKVLRRNDIEILILDERWNSLFANTEKTPEIILSEAKIKELLKTKAKLTSEIKDIEADKKKAMSRILELTPLVYEQEDVAAKAEMQGCEQEIIRINRRLPQIEDEFYTIEKEIKDVNLRLLEIAVNIVYLKIRKAQKRKEELIKLIEETKEKLMLYIDEKESIAEDSGEVYTYFHDLLGPDELERLDHMYIDKK